MVGGVNRGAPADAGRAAAADAGRAAAAKAVEPEGVSSKASIPSAALLALAERCEQAAGPDRELDTEIWQRCVASMEQIGVIEIGREAHGEREAEFRLDRMMDGARYTASIDAAMTLVPEGWGPVIDMASEDGGALVDLWALPTAVAMPLRRHAKAATAALALCAAALRARAAQ